MSYLNTFAPERPWGQVCQMREGRDGASQREPSLPLYIAVQESWEGLHPLCRIGKCVFGDESPN